MLKKQIGRKNAIFVTIGILNISFKHEPYLCNSCHDLMRKAMSVNNIAIVYIKWMAYRIHFWYMSKDDAIKIMNGSNLTDKRAVL